MRGLKIHQQPAKAPAEAGKGAAARLKDRAWQGALGEHHGTSYQQLRDEGLRKGGWKVERAKEDAASVGTKSQAGSQKRGLLLL